MAFMAIGVQDEAAGAAPPIGLATVGEVDGLIALLRLRPPAFWMRRIEDPVLARFVAHAISDPRCVILVARAAGEEVPAGYLFSIRDPRRFWHGFVARHPIIALSILYHQLSRRVALRRLEKGGDPSLPAFSWSPASPDVARVLGLYVRAEHRRKGIALELYFRLFSELLARRCRRVEEYMGPDYPHYAGKLPEVCGWQLQKCRCGGYKITKDL
jgi:hypothetical protein